jgi:putative FmdB family regulatory protein
LPTYGYRCTNCGHEFEIHQRMSDESLTVCPKCQGKLRKVIYPTGAVFKGSGFYTTDYKSSSGKPSANGSSGAEKASEKKTESKAEAKPESKSDSGD